MSFSGNPLDWKREHKAALAVAVALGAFVGLVPMFYSAQSCLSPYVGSREFYPVFGIQWSGFIPACWPVIAFWPIAGGVVGGGLAYVARLLRT